MSVEDFECDDFEKTLKIIVVGNGSVGKTSMTTRYTKGRYTDCYKKTIGVDFMEKRLELRDMGESIHLMIWDTAGQEEFGSLTSRYYKGAGAVIYVFSTIDRDSFEALPRWQRKVEEECGRISHVLVQNKIDLEDDAAMTRGEVEDMADYMRVKLFRTCVQDNVNVQEVFEYLSRQYLRHGTRGTREDSNRQAVPDITTLGDSEPRRHRSSRSHSNMQSRGSPRAERRYHQNESSEHSENEDVFPKRKSSRGSRRDFDDPDDWDRRDDRDRGRDRDRDRDRDHEKYHDRDRDRDRDRERRQEAPRKRSSPRGSDGRRSRSGFRRSEDVSPEDALDNDIMREDANDTDERDARSRQKAPPSPKIPATEQRRYASPLSDDEPNDQCGNDNAGEGEETSDRSKRSQRSPDKHSTSSAKDSSPRSLRQKEKEEAVDDKVAREDDAPCRDRNKMSRKPSTSSSEIDHHGKQPDDDNDAIEPPSPGDRRNHKEVADADEPHTAKEDMQPVDVEMDDDGECNGNAEAPQMRASVQTSTATESGRLQPSKRRTNGKKKSPLLHKLEKFVHG